MCNVLPACLLQFILLIRTPWRPISSVLYWTLPQQVPAYCMACCLNVASLNMDLLLLPLPLCGSSSSKLTGPFMGINVTWHSKVVTSLLESQSMGSDIFRPWPFTLPTTPLHLRKTSATLDKIKCIDDILSATGCLFFSHVHPTQLVDNESTQSQETLK